MYEPDKFRLIEWSKANDKEVLIKTFDNKMNLISTDKVVPVAGKPSQAKIIGKDFEVVLEGHSAPRKKDIVNEKLCVPISETRQISDKDGKLLRTEYLTLSEVEGLHNWKAVMPDGTVKPIIDVKKSKNGILTVTKDMEALDGTVTKSKYRKLPDGSWAMRLNISKDGKILSGRNVKHKMISANEAESTVNGKKYKVLYSSDEIKILNAKGETDVNFVQVLTGGELTDVNIDTWVFEDSEDYTKYGNGSGAYYYIDALDGDLISVKQEQVDKHLFKDNEYETSYLISTITNEDNAYNYACTYLGDKETYTREDMNDLVELIKDDKAKEATDKTLSLK